MASIGASDLLVPNGPVDSKLFPGLESNVLDDRLEGFITRAKEDPYVLVASADRKARMTLARALQYVFESVLVRMTAEPATVNITEKGSHNYTTAQLQSMKDLATRYRLEFESLIVATTHVAGNSQLPGSRSAGITVQW